MANPRVARGRKSQHIVADYWRSRGWPEAKAREASLPGKDIYDCGALAPEVKATEVAKLPAAVRQAKANADDGELPMVIYRPRGFGEARVDEWLIVFDLATGTQLLREAGYALEG